ncbi:hypothetical protein [Spirosoma spitsbergense]|uniref:hypothetical protein n=1 Tax=Spirosoma spitsbergense TaxID=431554 RepID=UPI000366655C|nr:hypothetical protein [Spirosoma spitsbergense]
MDTLTLEYRHRPGELFVDGLSKAERKHIDFIVSGQSLGQLVSAFMADRIGIFGWIPDKWHENDRVDEFLGLIPPELTTGRTSFYVCPECGDIGCGAITAKIEVTEKQVIWKEFGYETNYSAPDLSRYQEVGPFIFERTVYAKTFEKLRRLILER